MTENIAKQKNAGEITLSGDLTISQALEIHSLLREALESSDDVRITLQDVTAMDLSCLQLLCSAHRTAALEKKRLGFASPPPSVFRETVAAAGLKRHSGCTFSPNTGCLYKDGGE